MTEKDDVQKKVPLMCRIFGHKWRIEDRSKPHDYEGEAARKSSTEVCVRCGVIND